MEIMPALNLRNINNKTMKTENQYIKIVETKGARKTRCFDIWNKKADYIVGEIYWYGAWRQYCLLALEGMVFNNTCLELIINFLNDINEKHRSNWKQKKEAY